MPLKNFWYVAAQSSAITNKPKRITMLGQNFVLYRSTTSGQVAALNDLCAHCGGALSDGWVEDDCICCPYHGWKFRADGACIEIPANPPGTPIPAQAQVDAYPVQEKYGWIWVFLGNLPEAERPPLPPLPEFEDPTWRIIHGKFRWNAPYTHVVENGIDISHLPFVHGFERQIAEPYDIHLTDWSGRASVKLQPPRLKGLWKYIKRQGGQAVKATATFLMPNITREDVDFGASQFILFAAHLPVDDRTTLTYWIGFRNFFTHCWADGDARRRNLKTFLQDQRVVEAQRLELLPCDLSVPSDVLKVAYRKLHRQYLDRGWGTHQHRIPAPGTGMAVVIPSPSRGQVPELAQAWARKEMLVQPGDNAPGNGKGAIASHPPKE